jgi:class 3 adenylate cyclase
MDIAAWLRGLNLERYEADFRVNDIDGEVLHRLTAEDLRELGVTSIGHRRRLLDAIAALGAPNLGTEPTPVTAATGEAERRQLTVMFCDLVGSTALSVRFDPEELREEIRAYQNTVSAVVARYDGFVAKYMGDGVLAYFGYPRAHEDDAERAVRAGLEIASAVSSLETRGTEPLAVRIGIATGLVVVGDLVGEGSVQEQAVVGETPNLAARLQALAQPGQIVLAGNPPPDRRPVPAHRSRPADGEGLCRAGRGLRGRRCRRDGKPLRGGAPRAHRPHRPGAGECDIA